MQSVRSFIASGYRAYHFKDSLIFKRSGLVRVTAVARSNYDLVNSTWPTSFRVYFLCLRESVHLEEGVNFKSGKYGEINGWKPDRRKFILIPLDFVLNALESVQICR